VEVFDCLGAALGAGVGRGTREGARPIDFPIPGDPLEPRTALASFIPIGTACIMGNRCSPFDVELGVDSDTKGKRLIVVEE
jgi:hypothetical protein